jgi:CheY-like chemotaxis protein
VRRRLIRLILTRPKYGLSTGNALEKQDQERLRATEVAASRSVSPGESYGRWMGTPSAGSALYSSQPVVQYGSGRRLCSVIASADWSAIQPGHKLVTGGVYGHYPAPQLSRVARARLGIGVPFQHRRAARRAQCPAAPRTHTRGRDAASGAVREQVRRLPGSHVAAHTLVLLIERGGEGLAQLLNEPPDVVLLDLKMPEMTGFELLDRMSSNANMDAVPAIVLTSAILTQSKRDRFRRAARIMKSDLSGSKLTGAITDALGGLPLEAGARQRLGCAPLVRHQPSRQGAGYRAGTEAAASLCDANS